MSIAVNGTDVELPDDPRVSLLDLLREKLRLSGTKKGCDQGACGACTVLVDDLISLPCDCDVRLRAQPLAATPERVAKVTSLS